MPEPGGTDTVGGGGGPPGGLGGDRGFGGNRDGRTQPRLNLGKVFGPKKARTKTRTFDPFSMTFSSGGGQFGSGRKSLLSRRDGFKFT